VGTKNRKNESKQNNVRIYIYSLGVQQEFN
jgi:hypothetical protein